MVKPHIRPLLHDELLKQGFTSEQADEMLDMAYAAGREMKVARLEEENKRMRDLLERLVDEDECWFDHHGGCQAHGFLSLKPGEMCPNAEAKQILGRDTDPAEGSA